jgi:hypothetical protein
VKRLTVLSKGVVRDISGVGHLDSTIRALVTYILCKCLHDETCPKFCHAGKDGDTGALWGAILAGSGHLAAGFPSEDCPGATAIVVLPSPVTHKPILRQREGHVGMNVTLNQEKYISHLCVDQHAVISTKKQSTIWFLHMKILPPLLTPMNNKNTECSCSLD